MAEPLLDRGKYGYTAHSCRTCGETLQTVAIDIAMDKACCPKCGTDYAVAELIRTDYDLTRPPATVAYERTATGFVLTAPLRSRWPWVALGIGLGVGWRYIEPALFPPIAGVAPDVSVGGARVYALLAATVFVGLLSVHLFGRIRISRNGALGELAIGVPAISRRTRFVWSDIDSIREVGQPLMIVLPQIVRRIDLTDCSGKQRRLSFGSLLDDERRWYLLAVLRDELARARATANSTSR